MSTVAYRASLVREIEQSMKRITQRPSPLNHDHYEDGQLDAYAHMLTLIGDMEGE